MVNITHCSNKLLFVSILKNESLGKTLRHSLHQRVYYADPVTPFHNKSCIVVYCRLSTLQMRNETMSINYLGFTSQQVMRYWGWNIFNTWIWNEGVSYHFEKVWAWTLLTCRGVYGCLLSRRSIRIHRYTEKGLGNYQAVSWTRGKTLRIWYLGPY
jgi:hypothetical protein